MKRQPNQSMEKFYLGSNTNSKIEHVVVALNNHMRFLCGTSISKKGAGYAFVLNHNTLPLINCKKCKIALKHMSKFKTEN